MTTPPKCAPARRTVALVIRVAVVAELRSWPHYRTATWALHITSFWNARLTGLATGMDGKSLSRHIESLDEAARELGVRSLSEFFSADPEQMAEFMEGEGIDTGDGELPPLQQFRAQDGLNTVRALAGHAAARADGVAQDLRECERILSAAAQHGVRWHFEIDF